MYGGNLPTRFANTWNLTFMGQVSEADSTNAVISQVSMWPATDFAAVVSSGGELGLSLLL